MCDFSFRWSPVYVAGASKVCKLLLHGHVRRNVTGECLSYVYVSFPEEQQQRIVIVESLNLASWELVLLLSRGAENLHRFPRPIFIRLASTVGIAFMHLIFCHQSVELWVGWNVTRDSAPTNPIGVQSRSTP